MKLGKIINARTHAQFLNQILGKDYKQWYKSRYELDDGSIIWMIKLDGQKRDGWTNKFINSQKIIEEYTGETSSLTHTTDRMSRIVFEIQNNKYGRSYTFRGVFKYNDNESTRGKNVLTKISDNINI